MNLEKDAVSLSENRTLNNFPEVTSIFSILFADFIKELNSWFSDHIGFRDEIISFKARMDFKFFDKIDTSNMYIGKNGDLIYADTYILNSYQNKNVFTDVEIEHTIKGFNTINDYFNILGIEFFYVPCYDKHTIYPEQFVNNVYRYQELSRADQIISELHKNGNINMIDFKNKLITAKDNHAVYGNWSDPAHWTDRGVFIAYTEIMKQLNTKYNVNILKEDDYNITFRSLSYLLNNNIYKYDWLEDFEILDPKASKISKDILGNLANDDRHSVYYNASVDNDLKLLIIGDSYINSYLIDDMAESFKYTYMIWNSYLDNDDLLMTINNIDPDIIILENAERIDIISSLTNLADRITQSSY